MNGAGPLPLAGVRVVEVAQYVAGPLCGALLGELGAEVVKVEPPGGDAYRGTMPVAPGLGRFFLPLNRGKRSCILDLKSQPGRDALAALVATADIVLHNANPERARSFGLDWHHLHEVHPTLVVGIVTSFGAAGPLAGAPAYDLVAQARSGLLTAHSSPGDTVPVRAGGVPLADLAAGMLLATGVLASLAGARSSGIGTRIEVPLLAAALTVQIQDAVWLGGEETGRPPTATRTDLAARADEIQTGLATNPYYRCYETTDGFLAVACLNPAQRNAFATLLGLDDPTIEAPDVLPNDPALVERKRAVTTQAEDVIRGDAIEHWLARLGEVGVPCGPVHARERVVGDPQLAANDMLATVAQPGLGDVTMLGRVFGIEGSGSRIGPAPLPGEHTAEILRELGL